jgi:AraC family transcriptional regulator
MKQSTRNSYRQRVIRVIEYIYNNLESDLSVDSLAEIAFMSPFHFHRIYRELARETVNATIRRLRLQQAAVELIRSKQPIARIAKRAAYGSQEAFSRALIANLEKHQLSTGSLNRGINSYEKSLLSQCFRYNKRSIEECMR